MSRASDTSPARRWALVAQRLRAEARTATAETKMAQLASLMASVDDFGWRPALVAEEAREHAVWNRLRTAWKRGSASTRT